MGQCVSDGGRGVVHSLLLLSLLLSGCAGPIRIPPEQMPGAVPIASVVAAYPGPYAVTVEQGSLPSPSGCRLAYAYYRPKMAPPVSLTVILAHGFLRSATNMQDWGRHWASHGLATVIPDLCNMRPWAGRHERNAADLVTIAEALGIESRIYAGFSAGALAALLAARDDPKATAVLALDPVLPTRYRQILTTAERPRLLILGAPSRCNAHHKGLSYQSADAPPKQAHDQHLLHIPYASHCHFEAPLDPDCRLLCGEVLPTTWRRPIMTEIRGQATGWLLRQQE